MTLLEFTERALIVAGIWVVACVAALWFYSRALAASRRHDARELRRSAERSYRESV